MSSANTTMYYSAVDDMFKDMILDTSSEEPLQRADNTESQSVTPKRQVRIRKHNIFAKDTHEYLICRRQPMSAKKLDLSPGIRDMRKEQQSNELLRLRREHWQTEQKKPERRFAMRI